MGEKPVKIAPIKYLKPRWNHQRAGEERAVELYLAERARAEVEARFPCFGFMFSFEPGTGKTGTAINTLRQFIYAEDRMLRVLIFCPPVVCTNWKKEFGTFSKIDLKQIHVLQDKGEKRLAKFESTAFDMQGNRLPAIFITNYEGIIGKPGSALQRLYRRMLDWQPEVLILDESHYLKDGTASRTKLIEAMANPCDPKTRVNVARPAVLCLTGTPVLNNQMDLFSQFLIMDGGQTFGDNFFVFRAKYFYDKNKGMKERRATALKYFPEWCIKPKAQEQIEQLIAQKSMSALKKDCLDLPPLIEQMLEVDMVPEQARVYDEMERQLIAYIEGEACIAKLAITQSLRLIQIASGFVRTEDGTDIPFKENKKLDALSSLLSDFAGHHKIIVWAAFKPNYIAIKQACARLKLPFVTLHGGMTPTTRDKAIEDFEFDNKVRVLLGHPEAGGIGANLTASSYSIDYSRTFRLGHRLQSKARNFRGGSERHQSITQVDLVTRGTIEERILKQLDGKNEISLSILKAALPLNSLGGRHGKR